MAARGGLLPLPRPNMQKMSQGGIMGYKNGEEVEGEGSRLEQALKTLGISYKDYMAMRPEQKKELEAEIQKEYIEQRKEYVDSPAQETGFNKFVDKLEEKAQASKTPERIASDAAQQARYDKKQSTGKRGLDALLSDESLLQEERDQVDAINTQPAASTQLTGNKVITPDQKSAADLAREALEKSQTLAAPAVKTVDPFAGIKGEATKRMNANVQEGADAAAKRSDEYLGREAKAATAQGGIDSLKNLTEKVQKPSFLDDKRALFAAAGRGGIQGVMDIGLMQDRQRDQFAFSKLREATKLENEKIKADIDIGRIGVGASNAVFGALTQASNEGMSLLGSLSMQETKNAIDQAKAIALQNKNKLDSEFKILNLKVAEERNRLISLGDERAAQAGLVKLAQETYLAITETAAQSFATGGELFEENERYKAKNNGADKPDFSDEEASTLNAFVALVAEQSSALKEYQETLKVLKDMTGSKDNTENFNNI